MEVKFKNSDLGKLCDIYLVEIDKYKKNLISVHTKKYQKIWNKYHKSLFFKVFKRFKFHNTEYVHKKILKEVKIDLIEENDFSQKSNREIYNSLSIKEIPDILSSKIENFLNDLKFLIKYNGENTLTLEGEKLEYFLFIKNIF